MGITDPSNFVPKLEANGSNFWKWDAAVVMYASLNDCGEILSGAKPKPEAASRMGWVPALEYLDASIIDINDEEAMASLARRADYDKSREIINAGIEKAVTKQDEKIRFWLKCDAALKMAFLQTLSREVYDAISGLDTAAGQYAEISRRYKEDGLNEACTAWAEFFKLRCVDCPNTIKFTDKFRAALNKLKDLKLVLPEKGILYQFILAIEDSYPEYARTIRRDLRSDRQTTLEAVINELNDEARRDDPVKAAAFAAKKSIVNTSNDTTDSNRQNTGGDRGGGRGRGRGRLRGGNNNGGGRGDSQSSTTPTPQSAGPLPATTTPKVACSCGRTHAGGGPNCWFNNPHLAPAWWSEKRKPDATAAVTVTTDNSAPSRNAFSFSFATVGNVAEVSELAMRIASRADYKHRTIVDTGATNHICNDLSKFIKWRQTTTCSGIKTGAGVLQVLGTGSIEMDLLCSDGKINTTKFSDVLYAPDMFVSIISHSKIRSKGLYYHGWDEKIYRQQDQLELAYTPEIDGIPNILQAKDELEAAQAFAFVTAHSPRPSSRILPTRKVSLAHLHELFGHANIADLKKLVATTCGLELSDRDAFTCEVCLLSNSHKQISRVQPNRATRPFERVHVDIVGPLQVPGDNKERYWIIYTDDFTRYRWIDTMEQKSGFTPSLLRYLRMVKVQYNINVAIVHVDNDTVLINKATRADLSQVGTVFEPSTVYTAHQNGVAESSNRVGEARTRLMMVGAPHIPHNKWPHAARYAIEIMNHCPTTAIPNGKTPRQLLLEFMNIPNPIPNLYALRTFGEPGWVHIPEQRRTQGDKFSPRATKQYFVGREGSRIYLMWDSTTNKITRTSSVKWAVAPLREISKTGLRLTAPPTPQALTPPELDNELSNDTNIEHEAEYSSPELGSQIPQAGGKDEAKSILQDLDVLQLPEAGRGFKDFTLPEDFTLPVTTKHAPRHFDVSSDMNARLILDSKRTRKPSSKAAAIAVVMNNPCLIIARAFAQALTDAPSTHQNDSTELPLEPTSHKKAMVHKYNDGWILAEEEEYKAHDLNGTWTESVTMPVGTFALPTKWVYKYKFNESGKLTRLKARLVVCGNRQDVDFWRETYAAVARSTTLKVLLAMVTALDLECHQADVVTAFLNGHLDDDEHIWIRLPDGRIVKVNKALYGLRRSPRLWYQELAKFLKSIGFNPIEADPCVFVNDTGLIILAYVDDLVMITQTTAKMAKLKAQLFSKFKCHDLGPISHYLGIRICRDRTKRTMELSMESYIDKLGTDFKRANAPRRYHPLAVKALKLQLRAKDDLAPPQLTQRYQSIIGKLLYPASQLRADIAFAVGYLARAMSNPTELHFEYALQVLDYLYTTKDLVMKFAADSSLNFDIYSTSSPSLGLEAFSDASFADAEDRKSTSGYLFKFAGGTICHRSSKQKLVTTSTTEAEYVGLTHAAKEAAWLARLLQQIGYLGKDARPIKLYGDNQPSIHLVHAEGHHERTKHVDIYYHYIKDRVRDGHIQLEHVGTKEMAADGLTKPLDDVAHNQFLYQIGLCKPVLSPGPQKPPNAN
jgi:hypothetical protein